MKDFWDELEIASGVIGEGAAQEFNAFRQVYKSLPDIDKVLQGYDFETPQEPSQKVALITAVAMRANQENIRNVFQVFNRFEDELNVFGMKLLFLNGMGEEIRVLPEWNEWARKNRYVFMYM